MTPGRPALLPNNDRSPGEILSIDVCICTFQRASLSETLASIVQQTGFEGHVRVIVADNDETPSAAPQVKAFDALGLDIHYVHAPARNISIARNACLALVRSDWIAFIDDDEIAAPTWLANLVAAASHSTWSAVFGPVVAIYPSETPAWLRQADLHSTRPVETPRGVDTGYTSNALVRRTALAGRVFDIDLGRSGGEDTDLFTRLYSDGARFGTAPDAVVTERVTPARSSLTWLMRRAFRSGQTHARRSLQSPLQRVKAIGVAAAKAIICFGLVVLSLHSAARWRASAVRSALHVGAVARLIGIREPRLYG